ncbi:MAG: hypothetical protein DRO76_03030 [Candidatus Altiarchaeales archaeon]|nr:MAG: hypothetical protein DRO76_03030 [Candidatus Altiarchaeales archaeon]
MEGIIHERIKPNGGIHIPKSVLAELGLKVREEIELRVVDRKLLIEPMKMGVDELSGSLRIDSKLVDELVEKEELFEPEV